MSQHVTVSLSAEQRELLLSLTRSGTSSARVQTRARILLLADRNPVRKTVQPFSYSQIAQVLQVCVPTVGETCRRFAREGLEAALAEKPRPGKAPKITGEVEARLILLACSEPPEGFARWTMQMLADKLVELKLVESISDSAICDRLKKTRSSHGKLRDSV